MAKFTVPVHCARVKDLVETGGTGPDLQAKSYLGEGGSDLAKWIKERKSLRRELDRMGELDRWLHSKPTLSEIEYQVMDRMEATRKTQTPPQLLPDMSKVQGGMQDDEVLISLQTVRMDSENHLYSSTLGGPTGRAVERFRRQCQKEYLDTLERCQQHKLPISKAALQRVCLHPGDKTGLLLRKADLSAVLRGQVSCINPPQEGKEEEDDENGEEPAPYRFHKEMSRRQTWRSDPNAFWPGHEDHVQLYQPVMSSRPESVLFQFVKHTPAPSTGYWPINQAGYYTSGDINRQKAYILCTFGHNCERYMKKELSGKMSRVLSSLLTIRENGLLFNLVGQDCTVSACAVVQLLTASAACKDQKSEWNFHSCGVACLVLDKKLHSSFIRLFCVKRAKLLWEQELYTPFEYLAPCPYFHTFPSDECCSGLNFADEEEAGRFYSAVHKSIKSSRARPLFIRTHSLDSASGWLLRDKLNACLTDSGKDNRSPSLKTPPPTHLKGASSMVGSEISPATNSTSSSSQSSTSLMTPTAKKSLSLAQKKGPLPPIPSNASTTTSNAVHKANLKNPPSNLSIPLPPPYPAPTINPTGVKKSASFAPGGNPTSILKRQRSLQLSAVMRANTHYEEDQ